jgi:patatin-like phospholipase/acyl hydrolase
MASSNPNYLILSFDGGGIRGLITAMILQEIQAEFPNFLAGVNLYAGTSTGSFIALGLADGMSLDTLAGLYSTQGPTIFKRYSIIDDTFEYVKYDNKGLLATLNNTVVNPQHTLSQLAQSNPQQCVLVTTLQLYNAQTQTWLPLALHNLPNSDTAANTTILDAAMSSSAAPTYFPPYNHPYYGYCVDGGMVSNNPATLALSMAIDPGLANVPLQNVWMLSLGTGASLDSIPNQVVESTGPLNYGIKNWMWPEASGTTPAMPLMSSMFDGVSEVDTYQCQQVLGNRFQRGNVQLPAPYALDDYKNIATLEGYVNAYLGKDGGAPAQNWVDVKNWISAFESRATS